MFIILVVHIIHSPQNTLRPRTYSGTQSNQAIIWEHKRSQFYVHWHCLCHYEFRIWLAACRSVGQREGGGGLGGLVRWRYNRASWHHLSRTVGFRGRRRKHTSQGRARRTFTFFPSSQVTTTKKTMKTTTNEKVRFSIGRRGRCCAHGAKIPPRGFLCV